MVKMKALKVEFKIAEKARRFLMDNGLYDRGYEIAKDRKHIYFPLLKDAKFTFPAKIVEKKLKKRISPRKFSISSFDSMGDIAIIEIPAEMKGKKQKIGGELLKRNKQFKVVAEKVSAVKGKYRVKKLKVIAGENRLETIYKENGCRFKIDLGKVYFSPRLSYERDRIAKQVKRGEKVLALFAGAGFYPIIIKRLQPDCKIVAIELNPVAVEYMRRNVRMNWSENVEIIEGDVNEKLKEKRFERWASRIIMPLPHTAYEFLDSVLFAAGKNCIVHFYYIPQNREKNAVEKATKLVEKACKRNKRKCRILLKRIVKTYAPHVHEAVIDFRLGN